MVSASLKPRSQVFDNALVPQQLAPESYVELWDAAPVLVWLVNSAVVGVAAALAVTVSSALVAFGFAVFRFPGRNVLFGLVLATMMLPGAVTMVPQYLLWNELGWRRRRSRCGRRTCPKRKPRNVPPSTCMPPASGAPTAH